MLDTELQDLVFALLDVGLSLLSSFLVVLPILPFGNGNVYSLPSCIETFLTCIEFYRSSQGRDCLESQIRLWTV